MTAAAAPTVKDQELMPFGLVESAGVNAFADFVPSKLKETESMEEKEKNDSNMRKYNTFFPRRKIRSGWACS